MESITSRERAQLAFNHQEADRVPFDLFGSASMIIDPTYFKLVEYLGLEQNQFPWRDGFTANYYDERLMKIFNIDFRRIFMPRSSIGKNVSKSDNSYICPWGITWLKKGPFINLIEAPLESLDIDGINNYNWPNPLLVWDTDGLSEQAKYLNENTSYAIVARNPVTFGLLDRACLMRGTQQFLMDMILDPQVAKLIIDKVKTVHLKMYDLFLSHVGQNIQMVETSDDLGSQTSLLISPKLYREFIKPAQKETNNLIRKRAPKAKIFFHCDGAVYDIIPDLIEIGVDILNPIQPSVKGMESERLKSDFGDKIVFHGGIDQIAIEGSNDMVREEVRNRIDLLAKDGGYILSTCNNIIDADPENISLLFSEATQYGKY
jgi:uroporphyrinogen decarboxylase